MRLDFPEGLPVKAMVEIGQIYWRYPGVPRANLTFYMNGTVTVFNMASYIKRMQDSSPEQRMMTQGMSLECDDDEVGIYLMMKYF